MYCFYKPPQYYTNALHVNYKQQYLHICTTYQVRTTHFSPSVCAADAFFNDQL